MHTPAQSYHKLRRRRFEKIAPGQLVLVHVLAAASWHVCACARKTCQGTSCAHNWLAAACPRLQAGCCSITSCDQSHISAAEEGAGALLAVCVWCATMLSTPCSRTSAQRPSAATTDNSVPNEVMMMRAGALRYCCTRWHACNMMGVAAMRALHKVRVRRQPSADFQADADAPQRCACALQVAARLLKSVACALGWLLLCLHLFARSQALARKQSSLRPPQSVIEPDTARRAAASDCVVRAVLANVRATGCWCLCNMRTTHH